MRGSGNNCEVENVSYAGRYYKAWNQTTPVTPRTQTKINLELKSQFSIFFDDFLLSSPAPASGHMVEVLRVLA